MLPDNTFRTRAYGAFELSTFLGILNCDFALTFVIDSAHRALEHIKNLRVGNSPNPKKIGS